MKLIYQADDKTLIWGGGEWLAATLAEVESYEGYGTLYNVEFAEEDDPLEFIQAIITVDGIPFLPWEWDGAIPADCREGAIEFDEWTANGVSKAIMLDGRPYLSPFERHPQAMTTAEVCDLLGVQRARVMQLIDAGTLDAQRDGREWLIDADSAIAYSLSPRKVGQPRKTR